MRYEVPVNCSQSFLSFPEITNFSLEDLKIRDVVLNSIGFLCIPLIHTLLSTNRKAEPEAPMFMFGNSEKSATQTAKSSTFFFLFLGGGNSNLFVFSPIPGEMIQFD